MNIGKNKHGCHPHMSRSELNNSIIRVSTKKTAVAEWISDVDDEYRLFNTLQILQMIDTIPFKVIIFSGKISIATGMTVLENGIEYAKVDNSWYIFDTTGVVIATGDSEKQVLDLLNDNNVKSASGYSNSLNELKCFLSEYENWYTSLESDLDYT